jgi:hypothetical protein
MIGEKGARESVVVKGRVVGGLQTQFLARSSPGNILPISSYKLYECASSLMSSGIVVINSPVCRPSNYRAASWGLKIEE